MAEMSENINRKRFRSDPDERYLPAWPTLSKRDPSRSLPATLRGPDAGSAGVINGKLRAARRAAKVQRLTQVDKEMKRVQRDRKSRRGVTRRRVTCLSGAFGTDF